MTIFFADGMDWERMQALLEAGQLPNVQRYFVEGGVGVEHAVDALPSITYANAVSIITGQFPGHHQVTGNRWFDPRTRVLRDYGSASTYRKVNEDFDAVTMYEVLGDAFTVSVQAHTRRGVSHTIDNVVTAGLDWLVGNYRGADARVGRCVDEVATIARREGRWPIVYFSYFPGLDEVGHHHGSDSPEYAQAMITVDEAIGRVVGRVEALAPAERRYYVLLSDHGHVPTPPAHAIDLGAWLHEHAHLRVWDKTRLPLAGEGLEDYDAVLVNGAFRRVALHLLRSAEAPDAGVAPVTGYPWIPELVKTNGIAAVCWHGSGDAVEIRNGEGALRVERRVANGIKTYRITDFEGEIHENLVGGKRMTRAWLGGWHDSRSWLEATADADWPDFVPQVVEMFDSPRTGDLVVFADADYSFSAAWPGGHGSCVRRDMHVPLYFAGPGLPAGGRIRAARLVDVVPTILDMLGVAAPAGVMFDGVSLLPALKACGPVNERQPETGRRVVSGS